MEFKGKLALAKGLRGKITVAPDKSISHRALIFSSLAKGTSKIRNLLWGEDVLRTGRIMKQLGISISSNFEDEQAESEISIQGKGLRGLQKTDERLYCGNSGTTMRLLLGLLSAQSFASSLTGDASLNKRPMKRVTDPLSKMGARISEAQGKDGRVLHIDPAKGLINLHYQLPVASAQVKSAILLASLYAPGETQIEEPKACRDHTEVLFKAMGVAIKKRDAVIHMQPPKELQPLDLTVPGDFSSAAFFIVAALLVPDSELLIKDVNLNPTRTGLLDVLLQMGGDIQIQNQSEQAGERCGDLLVKSSVLKNISVEGDVIPRLIDEIPILALAASCAEGVMEISDASELRVKETDRATAVAKELSKFGVSVQEKPDGLIITGQSAGLQSPHQKIQSYGDHRMAMMAVIADLLVPGAVAIDDVACIKISFPEFMGILGKICHRT
ncbi:MAG: 3-phosphoshikimate 1-carboxyvinyltransferase [Deltaproteobacteria bacterium]|nr:3-phosphoshikimate 1-carboxyvinyltransferase [Deltaproteobacteria bacterium]